MRAWLRPSSVLLVITLASPASRAEEPAGASRIAVVTDAPIALTATLRADLVDATVGKAFRLLEQALGGRLQVVVGPGAKDVPLPDLTLKDASTLGLLNLVAHLVPDLRIRVNVGDEFLRLADVLSRVGDLTTSPATTVVLVDLAPEDQMTGETIERKLRIYRLADFSEVTNVDDLATAIQTVWEVEPIAHVATLKFHKETNLLIVFGTPRHLALVDQVIEGVTGRAPEASKTERMAEAESTVKALEQALARLTASVRSNGEAMARLDARLGTLERTAKPVPQDAGSR
jgi:hypothetical protein